MPVGYSLNIGLNSVNPIHYQGWSGVLNACEADAEDMSAISKAKGFKTKTLLTKAATKARVTDEILKLAKKLKAGDLLFLTYSGHGGQLPDLNADEPDNQDETWCLFDAQVADDELYSLYGEFAEGVRILIFSDSCHSGSVAKLAFYQGTTQFRSANLNLNTKDVRYRFMPPDVALRTYRENKAAYDKVLNNPQLKDSAGSVKASILLLSGCQDNQLSLDGDFNGLFTANLLRVWNNGLFKKGYKAFHKQIKNRMPPDQTPNYFFTGAANPDFEGQTPFTV